MPYNGYTYLNRLIDRSDIVQVLNEWKTGCGDKLAEYKYNLLVLVKSNYVDAEDGAAYNGTIEVLNAAMFVENGHTTNTVLNTGEEKSRVKVADYMNAPFVTYLNTQYVYKESDDTMTLEGFIDELVEKHRVFVIREKASRASKIVRGRIKTTME